LLTFAQLHFHPESSFPQGEVAEKDQAHLSYGNNPLHDAARDGDLVLLEKILKRVPGTFTDNRCNYSFLTENI
jgi:hypothetical protein